MDTGTLELTLPEYATFFVHSNIYLHINASSAPQSRHQLVYRRLEYRQFVKGPSEQHRAFHCVDAQPRRLAGRPSQLDRAQLGASRQHRREPRLIRNKEPTDGVLHRRRQRLIFSRPHATQAHTTFAKYLEVQLRVRLELGHGFGLSRVDGRERIGEPIAVASNECLAEISLVGEVVVQGGSRQSQLLGRVTVTKSVEASHRH